MKEHMTPTNRLRFVERNEISGSTLMARAPRVVCLANGETCRWRKKMSEQPEALWLADWLDHVDLAPMDYEDAEKAAAELRRLHAVNAELLEALKDVVAFTGAHGGPYAKARAAIARAEGEQA